MKRKFKSLTVGKRYNAIDGDDDEIGWVFKIVHKKSHDIEYEDRIHTDEIYLGVKIGAFDDLGCHNTQSWWFKEDGTLLNHCGACPDFILISLAKKQEDEWVTD
jgi:hypothetical protein